MAVHRYWRAVGIEAYGLAGLDITEFQLLAGSMRVDASATLTSSIAPATGALANLKDDDTSTGATWTADALKSLVLAWDFGSGGAQEIDVGEGQPQRVRQGKEDDDEDPQQGGQDEQEGEPTLGQPERAPGGPHADRARSGGSHDFYTRDFCRLVSSFRPLGTVVVPRMMLWTMATALVSYSPYQGSL